MSELGKMVAENWLRSPDGPLWVAEQHVDEDMPSQEPAAKQADDRVGHLVLVNS